MISITTINKAKPTSVLFIHGLFATAGFWLPYIHFFRGFRLDFLNFDYIAASDDFDAAMEQVVHIVSSACPTAIICHSLGCSLGRQLNHPNTFLICDVGNATRLDVAEFHRTINDMLGIGNGQIKRGLEIAETLYKHTNFNSARSEHIYTPDVDEFFKYAEEPNFSGTHFEIAEAVAGISEILNGS